MRSPIPAKRSVTSLSPSRRERPRLWRRRRPRRFSATPNRRPATRRNRRASLRRRRRSGKGRRRKRPRRSASEALIVVSAPNYKDIAGKSGAYWLEPPRTEKSRDPCGMQAWLETVQSAPLQAIKSRVSRRKRFCFRATGGTDACAGRHDPENSRQTSSPFRPAPRGSALCAEGAQERRDGTEAGNRSQ